MQVRRAGKTRAEKGVAGWLEALLRGNVAEGEEHDMFIISILSARFESNNCATCRRFNH